MADEEQDLAPSSGPSLTHADLAHRFQFHPADSQNRKDAHGRIREVCLHAGEEIVDVTGPPSREQSLAITHLEEAMFWANAAVARGDGPST